MSSLLSNKEAFHQLTLKQKVGQFFMPAAFVNDTEEEIRKLERIIHENHIGALCFFHSRTSAATNFEGKKEVLYNQNSLETLKNLIQRYQKAARLPLLIAIDAEWGLAMRIENTPQYPYPITLGAIENGFDLIFEVGKNIAKDCKTIGIHWNLAPCVDINNNPNNPVIGYRSFGEDKIKVTQKASAFIKGMQSEGVLTCIKHFPGHGDTDTDSHLELPRINKSKKELLENELYPFQKLIDEGIDSVMVGHLSVPALADGRTISSSISKEMIKGLLRNEMGFEGVVISDALNMHAVSKNHPKKGELEWMAFDAGNDILCFSENIIEGMDTIVKKASEQQIEESFKRIWKLKEKAINVSPITTEKLINPHDLNKKIAKESITLFKGSEEDIAHFRKLNYCTLTIIGSYFDEETNDIMNSLEVMKSEVEKEENILLLITPPQAKPMHNFGFPTEKIYFVNELIRTKNVVLYLFGNPYFLNLLNIKKAKAVILVYQDFNVFQDVATDHFLGKHSAKGTIPIQIAQKFES